ncbi:tetratricopeptide repeat protein [Candidatus Omnitrophota bacterium]
MRPTNILIASIFFIVALGFSIYANSLNGDLLWDDKALIKDNTYISSWSNLSKIFSHDIGAGAGKHSKSYRPIQVLSYVLDFSIWKDNIRGYHLTNTILHILVALLIYLLVTLLFENRLTAFFTSILFIAHPIHTEAVAYISGRADLFVSLFLLTSLIFYIKNITANSKMLSLLMLLSYAMALLSRENGLGFLIIIPLYHYIFKKRYRLFDSIGIIVTTLLYFFVRFSIFNSAFSHPTSKTLFYQRVPGVFVAITNYARLLLFPFGLHMEHGNSTFSIFDPKAILGVVIFVSLISYAIVRVRKNTLVSFSILWFSVTLFPSSNLFPLNAYMAEHWLYLPSIGFFLVIADVGYRLLNIGDRCAVFGLRCTPSAFTKTANRKPQTEEQTPDTEHRKPNLYVFAAMVLLIAFYSVRTIQQNTYWRESLGFYERTLKYSPDSARVYYNLANTYKEKRELKKAHDFYKKSIDLEPNFSESYNNLGNVYNMVGSYNQAIDVYKKAIEVRPDFVDAYNNLGIVYNIIGKNDKAISSYRKAIEIDPEYAYAYNGLGIAYAVTNDNERAIVAYKKAIELDPGYSNAYNNIGTISYSMGKKREAVGYFKKAIELDPQSPDAYSSLADAYEDMGKREDALSLYNKVIKLHPEYARAYYGLGNLYSNMGRYKDAIRLYEKVLEIKPDNAYALSNMGMAYYDMNDYQRAIELFEKAINVNPQHAYAYNNLGMVYHALKRYSEATPLFKKATELSPEYAEAYSNLAAVYLITDQYELAIESHDKAIKLGFNVDPQLSSALLAHRRK